MLKALGVARVLISVLTIGVLGAIMQTAPASAASGTCPASGKCFTVAVSPASAPAGANTTFAFTITNETTTQRLGSVQITAPASFAITGAPGAVTVTSSSALFLNLSVAPGATTTVAVTATAPCGSGSYLWGIQAKQSNDFNGPAGNDFQLDPASSGNLAGMTAGACSLAFTDDGQPAGAAVNEVITSEFNSTGGPVKVEVLAASGQLDSMSTAAVTIALGSNPGNGTLSGTATVNAIGGVASFSDLAVSAVGVGYTFVATSPGITAVPSDSFTIWGSVHTCTTAQCTASSSSSTTIASVTVSSPNPDQILAAGLGGVDFTCAGSYQRVSDPFTFDVFSSTGAPQPGAQFTVTLQIEKSAVQPSGRTGASQWEICYASTQPFTAVAGTAGTVTIGGTSYTTGLLPDCSNSQDAPCVHARNKTNAGDVVVTFLATGDPFGWA